jgi:hypothetical protein
LFISKISRGHIRIILITSVILVAGIAFWYFAQNLAPLTAGLNGPWKVISAEFDKRVEAMFPLGSSEIDMKKELHRQGFSLPDLTAEFAQRGEAIRREDGFVCNKAAYIRWQADKQGRLTSISGEYREEGCL